MSYKKALLLGLLLIAFAYVEQAQAFFIVTVDTIKNCGFFLDACRRIKRDDPIFDELELAAAAKDRITQDAIFERLRADERVCSILGALFRFRDPLLSPVFFSFDQAICSFCHRIDIDFSDTESPLESLYCQAFWLPEEASGLSPERVAEFIRKLLIQARLRSYMFITKVTLPRRNIEEDKNPEDPASQEESDPDNNDSQNEQPSLQEEEEEPSRAPSWSSLHTITNPERFKIAATNVFIELLGKTLDLIMVRNAEFARRSEIKADVDSNAVEQLNTPASDGQLVEGTDSGSDR